MIRILRHTFADYRYRLKMSAHPLLQEPILSILATYVKHNVDQTACASVCRTWYYHFNSRIWTNIRWTGHSRKSLARTEVRFRTKRRRIAKRGTSRCFSMRSISRISAHLDGALPTKSTTVKQRALTAFLEILYRVTGPRPFSPEQALYSHQIHHGIQLIDFSGLRQRVDCAIPILAVLQATLGGCPRLCHLDLGCRWTGRSEGFDMTLRTLRVICWKSLTFFSIYVPDTVARYDTQPSAFQVALSEFRNQFSPSFDSCAVPNGSAWSHIFAQMPRLQVLDLRRPGTALLVGSLLEAVAHTCAELRVFRASLPDLPANCPGLFLEPLRLAQMMVVRRTTLEELTIPSLPWDLDLKNVSVNTGKIVDSVEALGSYRNRLIPRTETLPTLTSSAHFAAVLKGLSHEQPCALRHLRITEDSLIREQMQWLQDGIFPYLHNLCVCGHELDMEGPTLLSDALTGLPRLRDLELRMFPLYADGDVVRTLAKAAPGLSTLTFADMPCDWEALEVWKGVSGVEATSLRVSTYYTNHWFM